VRLALQTLAVLAAGTLLGVGANALSPRPAALGSAVRPRTETAGMCAAPAPAGPAPAHFAPAPPSPAALAPAGQAPFTPAPSAAPFQAVR
jgi:hypothetical protein